MEAEIRHIEHSGMITVTPLPGISMCPLCAVHWARRRIRILRGG